MSQGVCNRSQQGIVMTQSISFALHIPIPPARPSDAPDFSHLQIPPAGGLPRPEASAQGRVGPGCFADRGRSATGTAQIRRTAARNGPYSRRTARSCPAPRADARLPNCSATTSASFASARSRILIWSGVAPFCGPNTRVAPFSPSNGFRTSTAATIPGNFKSFGFSMRLS